MGKIMGFGSATYQANCWLEDVKPSKEEIEAEIARLEEMNIRLQTGDYYGELERRGVRSIRTKLAIYRERLEEIRAYGVLDPVARKRLEDRKATAAIEKILF